MFGDTMLGPWTRDNGGKTFIVWDNVSSHLNPLVKASFLKHGIELAELPPNTTSFKQVIDIFINGPVKADSRRVRAISLMDYFKWFCASIKSGDNPPWKPPDASICEGIMQVINCLQSFNMRPEFMQSLQRCFVKVGIMPKEDGSYVTYCSARPLDHAPERLLKNADDDRKKMDAKDTIPNEMFDLVEIDNNNDLHDGTDATDDGFEVGSLNLEPIDPITTTAPLAPAAPSANANPTVLKKITAKEAKAIGKPQLIKLLNERSITSFFLLFSFQLIYMFLTIVYHCN